ncbi:hypothetical protein EDB92DRAFT_1823048 [Lactarius akahatsu]|uniref:Uncharacterized protein n=1 Tax=Lactarius akahatsu TaxID=416441 RepID=A0AAD4L294_9AGAM|nr:hypothetical protein EDB92DRAFT_1823048 [Lactarius akahatsu]
MSDPSITTGLTGTAGTGGAPAGGPGGNPGGAPAGGPTPADDVIINPQGFIGDASWPKDLILDRHKSNWREWNHRLLLVTDQRLFSHYLDGSFPRPDPTTHPKAAIHWRVTDRALCAFILEHVAEAEYDVADALDMAHDVYETLCKMHEFLGLHAQHAARHRSPT